MAQSQGQMKPVWGGALQGPWFYGPQNKTLITVGFLSASTLLPRHGTAAHFSQKAAFYGAAAC